MIDLQAGTAKFVIAAPEQVCTCCRLWLGAQEGCYHSNDVLACEVWISSTRGLMGHQKHIQSQMRSQRKPLRNASAACRLVPIDGEACSLQEICGTKAE